MKQIKTGIVGYGFSGRIFQAPFIESNDAFELTAIVQRKGDDAKDDYSNIILYRDYNEMLLDESLELIIIATPAHLHFEHAMEALKAEKHVLVEKPFSATKEEAEQLVNKAKEVNKLITVYQNRRYDSDFLTIKKLMEDDVTIYEYEAVWDRNAIEVNHNDWHEAGFKGSDLLYDLGPHYLDQALHLFGMPDSWFGVDKALRPNSKIIDYFSITLEYSDKVVHLKSCMHAAFPDVRYKLHTNKGTYIFYKMDAQEDQLIAGMRPSDENYGDRAFFDHYDFKGNKTSHQVIKGDYTYYFDQLAKAIRNNKKLPVSPEDAIRVIAMLEEINKKN